MLIHDLSMRLKLRYVGPTHSQLTDLYPSCTSLRLLPLGHVCGPGCIFYHPISLLLTAGPARRVNTTSPCSSARLGSIC